LGGDPFAAQAWPVCLGALAGLRSGGAILGALGRLLVRGWGQAVEPGCADGSDFWGLPESLVIAQPCFWIGLYLPPVPGDRALGRPGGPQVGPPWWLRPSS